MPSFNSAYQHKMAADKLYARFNGKCGYCGAPVQRKGLIKDFIDDPINRPATPTSVLTQDLDWYMPSCFACNRYRQGFKFEGFRQRIKEDTIKRIKCELAFTIAKNYGLLKEMDLGEEPIQFYFERVGWTSDKTWDVVNQRPIEK